MVVDGKWSYSEADWANVAEQYSELSKDKNVSVIFNLKRDIAVLVNKCIIVEQIVNSLELADNPELWKVLKRLGLMGKDLKTVKTASQRFVHDLAEAQKELAKFVTDKKTTRQDFMDRLVALSEAQGYRIQAEQTSVAEYCSISNKYNDYVAAQNAQKDKSNGRRFN